MFKNEIVLKHMFVEIHSNPIFVLFQRLSITYIRHFRKKHTFDEKVWWHWEIIFRAICDCEKEWSHQQIYIISVLVPDLEFEFVSVSPSAADRNSNQNMAFQMHWPCVILYLLHFSFYFTSTILLHTVNKICYNTINCTIMCMVPIRPFNYF